MMVSSRSAIFLLVLLCSSLSACGGSGGGSDNTSGSGSQSASADSSAQINKGHDAGDQPTIDAEDQPGEPPQPQTDPGKPTEAESGMTTGAGSKASIDTSADDDSIPMDEAEKEEEAADTEADMDTSADDGSMPMDESEKEETANTDGGSMPTESVDPSPNDAPAQGSASWAGASEIGFQVISQTSRDQQDVPVTVGQVFARGEVPAGKTVAAMVDGQDIPVQVDKKATWRDGSLRHAVVTVRMSDLPAGGKPVVELQQADAPSPAPAVTLNQLLGTNFDAVAELDVNGAKYRASARDLLATAQQMGSCKAWGPSCKQWLSGPLTSEWIVGGAVDAGGQAQANLAVYFHVRAYANADGSIARVRVNTVVENDWAYNAVPKNVAYDATITSGEASYKISGLTHYDHARWHKVLWWGVEPAAYARLNGKYLQATGAVSRYADVTPSDDFLSGRNTRFTPMTNGDQTAHMGDTGAQPAIGPLPRWTSSYIVSTDRRAYRWMLATDDAVGSYSFHYRDPDTGRPLEITKHPYVTIAAFNFANSTSKTGWQKDLLPKCPGDADPPRAGDCANPYNFNISHHPSIGYVSYMVTGDYYYLEEMQFTASYVELWMNADYRDYDKGHLVGQVRGQSWSLRSIADAAFLTPDNDPLKAYYDGLMRNNLEEYNRELTDSSANEHPIHVLTGYTAVIYPMNGGERVGIAPWQQDFFTWAVGHAAEQGFDGADRLLKWLAAFQVGRMTNWKNNQDGFCWLQAATYKLQIRDMRDGADYASLDDAYAKTYPELQGLECNSQEMVNLWAGGKYDRGQMSGYAFSPTGFPSNLQIGLAMAAESGIADGRLAWQIFADRSVKPDYSDYPNFAVVPRP